MSLSFNLSLPTVRESSKTKCTTPEIVYKELEALRTAAQEEEIGDADIATPFPLSAPTMARYVAAGPASSKKSNLHVRHIAERNSSPKRALFRYSRRSAACGDSADCA